MEHLANIQIAQLQLFYGDWFMFMPISITNESEYYKNVGQANCYGFIIIFHLIKQTKI